MSHTFLKSVAIITMIGLLHVTCKKKAEDPPKVSYEKLKVMEAETNFPINNAFLKLYKDILLVDTTRTDAAGEFQFDSNLDIDWITASHSNYWDGSTGVDIIGNRTSLGNIYLVPLAYTKLHLKKTNVHPPDLLLVILVTHSHNVIPGYSKSFNQVDDSTVVLNSYGNIDNIIAWYFTNQAGTIITTELGGETPAYYINRFDTASVEINY